MLRRFTNMRDTRWSSANENTRERTPRQSQPRAVPHAVDHRREPWEHHLAAQLTSIRTAISSLEFGSTGVPAPAIIETPHAAGRRRRRKVSAAARVKMAAAQRKRWAKVRAGKK